MLVLGAEILFGFQLQAVFREEFDRLSTLAKGVNSVGVLLMTMVIALLVAPASFHRIVERGRDSERLHRYTTRIATVALLPFAVSLGLALFVVLERPIGRAAAAAVAGVASGFALAMWFLLELALRRRGRRQGEDGGMAKRDEAGEETPLSERINHLLTEARVVLPGAQALLGFQLAVILTASFERLDAAAKLVHIVSLGLVSIAVILLMTPAAYHRIVNDGEDTEDFYRAANRLVLLATIPLALGIAGDLYVVIGRTEGWAAGGLGAGFALVLFALLWYAYPFFRRGRRRSVSRAARRRKRLPDFAG
jgi:cytochrome b561